MSRTACRAPRSRGGRRRIDDLNAALHPSHFRIVAFGATAAALDEHRGAAPARPRRRAGRRPTRRRRSPRHRSRSGARRRARASWRPATSRASCCSATAARPPGTPTRRSHAGSRPHIPVSVEPLAPRSLGDTWIDSLDRARTRFRAGAAFTATVAVGSQRDGEAVVELRSGGKVLGTAVGRRSQGARPGRDRRRRSTRRARTSSRRRSRCRRSAERRTTRSTAACGRTRKRRCSTSKARPRAHTISRAR